MDFSGFIRKALTRVTRRIMGCLPGVINPYTKKISVWNKVFILSCLLALFVDPLFLFQDQISKKGRCVDTTRVGVHVVAFSIRSATDILYLLNMLLQFRLAYVDVKNGDAGTRLIMDPRKVAVRYLKGYFALDLYAVFPAFQIVKRYLNDVAYSNFPLLVILLQYLPRLCRLFPLIVGQSPLRFVLLNFLAFTLCGHVVGSVWYFLGLQRVQGCLIKACRTSGLPCGGVVFCGLLEPLETRMPVQEAWLNSSTAVNCFNVDSQYGVFAQAVDVVTQADFLQKYLYSLFWGFKQISTLCRNLAPTTDLVELVFTLAVIALSLLLFAFVIGNMNLFHESSGHRKLEWSQRKRDIEVWMTLRKLPLELRSKIREYEGLQWETTKGVNEKELLDSFPEDLQQQISTHLKISKELKYCIQ